jgi:hypothetical protein
MLLAMPMRPMCLLLLLVLSGRVFAGTVLLVLAVHVQARFNWSALLLLLLVRCGAIDICSRPQLVCIIYVPFDTLLISSSSTRDAERIDLLV